MEHFAVESDVDVQVEVLPVPVVALVVLGQSHALDQLALGHAAVLDVGLDDRDAVVFQVVVDDDGADAEELARGLVHGLLEVGIKLEYLEETFIKAQFNITSLEIKQSFTVYTCTFYK